MRSFVQQGDTITVTASRTAAMDTGMLVGQLFGITKAAATNAQPVEIARTGVFGPVPKATGQVWAQGVLIYWDNTNFNFTTTSAGNRLVGVTAAAALSGDTVGTVLLDGAAR